ncbi:MAG: helix-turn-helix domain-containing protein [Lentisphaeria bacterium]|jgi:transcriptional regulator with XRE-family HTH domain
MTETNAGNSFSAPEDTVFDGRITPEISRRLRQKRKSSGLSLRQLSRLLGVSWSTLHKWETGQIGHCRPRHIGILSAFASGKLDIRLSSATSPSSVFEFTSGQSVLLYVQTKENRAVIAFPANEDSACAQAFQSVIDCINDKIQAIRSTAQRVQVIAPSLHNSDQNNTTNIAGVPSPFPVAGHPSLSAPVNECDLGEAASSLLC